MPRQADLNVPDYEFVTMSFRVLGKHAKLIHRKARERHDSAAEYMRDLVCSAVGLSPADYAVASAASLSEIAKAQGITVREFEQRAIREAAERAARAAGLNRKPFTHGRKDSSRPPAHESGERAKVIASARR